MNRLSAFWWNGSNRNALVCPRLYPIRNLISRWMPFSLMPEGSRDLQGYGTMKPPGQALSSFGPPSGGDSPCPWARSSFWTFCKRPHPGAPADPSLKLPKLPRGGKSFPFNPFNQMVKKVSRNLGKLTRPPNSSLPCSVLSIVGRMSHSWVKNPE